ncbi:MAG: MopE-related protein [Pseudomonadota bacterium]|nr:MopE-related protein [Pseudomonadota bacterium]
MTPRPPRTRLRRGGALARLLALTLLLPGCLINTELYEQRLAALTDDDGDGQTELEGDCDDTNAAVGVGAPELCNGFDDNCEGGIDEVATGNDVAWAADADGDGYASDSATAYAACASPGAGWVSAWGDCDDDDDTTRPGAPEACDGRDNDCDSAADEEPTVSPPTWHPDEDEDGYGQLARGVSQCLAPEVRGWVQDDTDCDDTDGAIHPAAPERCNGTDDDCDDQVDEAPVTDAAGWYPDEDRDGYGDDAAAACTAAAGFVDVGGDCDDTDAGVNPPAAEVCNDGADNDCDGGPGDCVWDDTIDMTAQHRISAVYEGEGLGYAGGTGDLDGDGRNEIVVSAGTAYSPTAAAALGAVMVFRTPITTDLTEDEAEWTFWGDHDHSGAGSSIVVHDLDGDGFDDLQVGSGAQTVDGQMWAGTLYTVFGPLTGGGLLEEEADWKLVGTTADESIGMRAYALGDLDGDGLPDFGTGYEFIDHRGLDRTGAVYVFTTVGSGTEAAADTATAVIYGSEEYDEIGLGATGLDLDGDGFSDLVVGAQGYDSDPADGAALVFMGPVAGSIAGDDADLVFTGESSASYAGRMVDTVGDINGDGLDDLLVGAPQTDDGAAYLIWGASTLAGGPLADANVKFRGDRANYFQLGYSLDGLGDLNEDGWPDLFISENYYPGGQGYVFFGPLATPATYQASTADVVLSGDGRSDAVYETAFTPGDATGDGVSDLVVGSYKYGGDAWDGVVYLVPGVGY